MDSFKVSYRLIGLIEKAIVNIDMVLLILLVTGAVLLGRETDIWGRRFVFMACSGFIFFAVVPVGLWLLEGLENRFPKIHHLPQNVKGIIFLGGSFDQQTTRARGETAYNLNAGRFIQFVALARQYPHLQLVCTGTPLETEITKKELKALGFNYSAIVFEDKSKDTIDNSIKTAKLLSPQAKDKWVLVTSAYHMPRSVGLFRKAGFTVIPYPLNYHTSGRYAFSFFLGLRQNLNTWHTSAGEWLGIIANYIMGRSDELFPK